MADEEATVEGGEVNPVDLLKKVEAKAATNKILMITVLVLSGG